MTNSRYTDEQIQLMRELIDSGAKFDAENRRWTSVPLVKISDDGTHAGDVFNVVHMVGGRDRVVAFHEWYDLEGVEEGMVYADDLLSGYRVFINHEEAHGGRIFETLEAAIGYTAIFVANALENELSANGAGPYGYYNDAYRALKGRASRKSWSWHSEADYVYNGIDWDRGASSGTDANLTFSTTTTSTSTTGTYTIYF